MTRKLFGFFFYEGAFVSAKKKKKCGCIGHYTNACSISDIEGHRRIHSRVADLGSNGFPVLYGPMNLAYYTNCIEGLPDRFRFRNSCVNLYQHIEDDDPPLTRRFLASSDDQDSNGRDDN